MKQRQALRHPMQWVGGGVHIVYHEPSTDPIHLLPLTVPRALVRLHIFVITCERVPLVCVQALDTRRCPTTVLEDY